MPGDIIDEPDVVLAASGARVFAFVTNPRLVPGLRPLMADSPSASMAKAR